MFEWVDTASERAIENLFLKILGGFDDDDLQEAVDRNISLLLLTKKHRPKLLRTASAIAGRFRNQGHLLTMDNVMNWLEAKRGNLWFKIMLDGRKREWLNTQVNDFKKFLFG